IVFRWLTHCNRCRRGFPGDDGPSSVRQTAVNQLDLIVREFNRCPRTEPRAGSWYSKNIRTCVPSYRRTYASATGFRLAGVPSLKLIIIPCDGQSRNPQRQSTCDLLNLLHGLLPSPRIGRKPEEGT